MRPDRRPSPLDGAEYRSHPCNSSGLTRPFLPAYKLASPDEYPGFGGSTGPARLAKVGPAALTALDALAAIAGDKPIMVLRYSFAPTAALCAAAHRPVAGALLQDSPALRQMIVG